MYLTDSLINEYDSRIEILISDLRLKPPIHTPLTVQEAHTADLLDETNSRRNILGFGYGEKIIGGQPQGVLAIAMYVVRKSPAAQIHHDFLAESLLNRFFGNRYLSDVIEVGRPRLFHHVGRKYDNRIPGGASISANARGGGGTLGGWLTDEDGNYYLLSCWHCIDGITGGGIGKEVYHQGEKIATIELSSDPRSSSSPTIDATLAKVDSLSRIGDFILHIGEIRGIKRIKQTYIKVKKFGVISHLTKGGIIHLRADMTLHAHSIGQDIFYEKQLLIQPDPTVGPFASDGDSGSLVLTEDNYGIGLLIGGEDVPPQYIATPIIDVLDTLSSHKGGFAFLVYP
jgi:hypothetical protein